MLQYWHHCQVDHDKFCAADFETCKPFVVPFASAHSSVRSVPDTPPQYNDRPVPHGRSKLLSTRTWSLPHSSKSMLPDHQLGRRPGMKAYRCTVIYAAHRELSSFMCHATMRAALVFTLKRAMMHCSPTSAAVLRSAALPPSCCGTGHSAGTASCRGYERVHPGETSSVKIVPALPARPIASQLRLQLRMGFMALSTACLELNPSQNCYILLLKCLMAERYVYY